MGRYAFRLPDVGEGTAEAEIVEWRVGVGERVEEDAPLLDVMTDKATVEMTSPVAGTVLEINGEPGDMASVGSVVVVFEVAGAGNADPSTPIADSHTPAQIGTPPLVVEMAPRAAPTATVAIATPSRGGQEGGTAFPGRAEGEKPLASPAVRRRAEDLGVRLAYVAGSGPAGRILQSDLDAYIASGGQAPNPAGGGFTYAKRMAVEAVKVIGLRRKIAEKMQEAKRRIPHFAYVEEVDMTELDELRGHLNAVHKDRPKLTVLPFFMRALVKVLPAYPQINARFDDEAGVVHRHAGVHIGIATQTANGLIVPVVRHAETLDLWAAAAEVARLAEATRNGKARPDELNGSTITVTSLGPLGGIVTTPVINHPEVAIISPNKILERPVARHGQIVVRKMMNLSSSFDHRVVDGFDAAEFIQRVKALLEHPAALFLD